MNVPSATIRQHVKGEAYEAYDAYAGMPREQQIPPPPFTEVAHTMPHIVPPAPQPEYPPARTELPFTDPPIRHESIDQGIIEPMPTVQVRKFSAPHMEWDATR